MDGDSSQVRPGHARRQLADRLVLARAQQSRGDLAAALGTLTRILEDGRDLGGATVLTARRMFAEIHLDLHHTGYAHKLARALLDDCGTRLGAAHPATIRAACLLAATYHRLGDLDAAERLCRQVIAAADPRRAPGRRALLLSRVRLALVTADRADHDTALPALARAFDDFRDRYGDADLDALRIASRLAQLYASTGDRPTARRVLTRAHHAATGRLGPAHPLTAELEALLERVEPPMPTDDPVPPPGPSRGRRSGRARRATAWRRWWPPRPRPTHATATPTEPPTAALIEPPAATLIEPPAPTPSEPPAATPSEQPAATPTEQPAGTRAEPAVEPEPTIEAPAETVDRQEPLTGPSGQPLPRQRSSPPSAPAGPRAPEGPVVPQQRPAGAVDQPVPRAGPWDLPPRPRPTPQLPLPRQRGHATPDKPPPIAAPQTSPPAPAPAAPVPSAAAASPPGTAPERSGPNAAPATQHPGTTVHRADPAPERWYTGDPGQLPPAHVVPPGSAGPVPDRPPRRGRRAPRRPMLARRGLPLWGLLAAAVVATGVAVNIASHHLPGGRVPASASTASAATRERFLAGQLTVLDGATPDALAVTWVDPSGGTATPVVAIATTTGQTVAVATLPPGTSTYAPHGLDPAADYCALVALYADPTDTSAVAARACLHRRHT